MTGGAGGAANLRAAPGTHMMTPLPRYVGPVGGRGAGLDGGGALLVAYSTVPLHTPLLSQSMVIGRTCARRSQRPSASLRSHGAHFWGPCMMQCAAVVWLCQSWPSLYTAHLRRRVGGPFCSVAIFTASWPSSLAAPARNSLASRTSWPTTAPLPDFCASAGALTDVAIASAATKHADAMILRPETDMS